MAYITRALCCCMLLIVAVGCSSQPSHDQPYVAERAAATAEAPADAAPLHRVLLLGDAGFSTLEPWQPSLERAAARASLAPDDTTVIMLGDNIYYRGFPTRGDDGEVYSKAELALIDRLKAQLKISAVSGAQLYVVPGNHDWYAEQVDDQARFIEEYGEEHDLPVHFEPWEKGQLPLPEAIHRRGVSVVFLDSMWLIRGEQRDIDRAMQRLDKLLRETREEHPDNIVLLAAHHPIESMGPHNLYHTSAAYRFAVGLIDLFADIGDQDLPHPDYARVINAINEVMSRFDGRAIYAAGHDHSLQVFGDASQDPPQYRIVSGAANSRVVTGVGHNDNTLFAVAQEGFVELDIYRKGILLRAYTIEQEEPVFEYWLWHQADVRRPATH